MTLYPGTGFTHETGTGEGLGYTLNLPLDPHSGDDQYRSVWEQRVDPAVRAFEPDFLLVSAGFDAAKADPLALMNVTPAGFAWMTDQVFALARDLCDGRLVSVLEGGYDLRSLSECVSVHLDRLMQGDGRESTA